MIVPPDIVNVPLPTYTPKRSGATLPNRFRRIVDRYGDDPDAMKQAGIAYATEQIVDLLANGVCGIHVYTMNKPDVAKAISENLSYLIAGDGKN